MRRGNRGASEGTPYRTAAANGVIQVTTKRGRAGATRITGFGEAGSLRQTVDLPASFANVGTIIGGANAGRPTQCTNDAATRGTCAQGTIRSLSPAATETPFRHGLR